MPPVRQRAGLRAAPIPPGDETPEGIDNKVYTYLTAGYRFEKFCCFGCLLYLEAFLFLAICLPLRIVGVVWHLLKYPFNRQGLQPAQVCDLMKVCLFFLLYFLFSYETIVKVFDMVKRLADVELLVIYTALELFDRLLSGVGQDFLDSLYRTTTEPARFRNVCLYFIRALLCIAFQTILIIGKLVVLWMAFENMTLLNIMISISIGELEQVNEMNENNLLQVSCSDVRQRFHLTMLLLYVVIIDSKGFGNGMLTALLIILLKIMVTWIKHSFITKFSEMPAETYWKFTVNLARDISTINNRNEFYADHLDLMSRKMDWTPIPLVCLLVIVFIQFLKHYDSFGIQLIIVVVSLILMKPLTACLRRRWCNNLLQGAQ